MALNMMKSNSSFSFVKNPIKGKIQVKITTILPTVLAMLNKRHNVYDISYGLVQSVIVEIWKNRQSHIVSLALTVAFSWHKWNIT